MKNGLLALLVCVFIVGCSAERYFVGNGVEALIYEEKHRVELVVKERSQSATQLAQVIDAAERQNATAHYTFIYRTKAMKSLAQGVLSDYPELTLDNHRVSYLYQANETADLIINITLHKLNTELCKPSQVLVETYQRNCFIESSRMQQVVNKPKLVGE
ncbi:hypothetical protein [Vibrio variabilis]|uniref:hypothetical protein n=1 Tax=Vibrio variabilis TaxID=990271 RepID=UPI000DD86125|nr:hypothetical protein [Vibrio variabilis]